MLLFIHNRPFPPHALNQASHISLMPALTQLEVIITGLCFLIGTQLNYSFVIYLSTELMYFFFFPRKIEIVQFASRTRQLFVRLLALVKWANNAGKVEKCAVS